MTHVTVVISGAQCIAH